MFSVGGRREGLIMFGTPALIVALGCCASLLPPAAVTAVLNILTAWIVLSIPLAVLFGHCTLSED